MSRSHAPSGRKRSVCSSPHVCAICLLPIPHDIASKSHPLLWTVDHWVPLSKGGSDNWKNRVPAHNVCNKVKRDDYPIEPSKRVSLVHLVAGEMVRRGLPLGKKSIPDIVREITGNHNYKYDVFPDLQRWEDDGGMIYQVPHWRKSKVAYNR